MRRGHSPRLRVGVHLAPGPWPPDVATCDHLPPSPRSHLTIYMRLRLGRCAQSAGLAAIVAELTPLTAGGCHVLSTVSMSCDAPCLVVVLALAGPHRNSSSPHGLTLTQVTGTV